MEVRASSLSDEPLRTALLLDAALPEPEPKLLG
jgi:hypothetical protein